MVRTIPVMEVIIAAVPLTDKIIAASGCKNVFWLCLAAIVIAQLFYPTQKEYKAKIEVKGA